MRVFGVLLGLAGCAAVAVSIHFLLLTASCGGDAPACPADMGPWLLLLPVGIIAAVAAMFLGGLVFFPGLFIAVGVGALSTLLPLHGGKAGTDDPWFAILFGGGFVLGGLLPLGLAFAGRRKAADAAALVQAGKPAVGTVLWVRDTGVTINGNPRVSLGMRAEPTDGSPPVELQKDVTVSRLAVPQVGDRFPVWFDPARPERWAYGTDLQAGAPAAVRALFAKADQRAAASAPVPAPQEPDPFDEIARLAALRDTGAITADDYETTKARLLRRIG